MNIATAAFTDRGRALARRLMAEWPGHTVSVFDAEAEAARMWTAKAFQSSDALLFIGAAGIAVRHIAPLLKSKAMDPAVLVMDEFGRNVVPLLSGHMGGANRLALELASLLRANPVITTATDLNGVFAVDVWAVENQCAIADVSRVKAVSSALLRGESVGLHCDFPVQGPLPRGFAENSELPVGVCISLDSTKRPFPVTLNLVPRIAVLGAGCRKNRDTAAFAHFVLDSLAEHNVDVRAVKTLATVNLKQEEPCLHAFALACGADFVTYTPEELRQVDGHFSASPFVQKKLGVDNVCERAAMRAVANGTLRIPKTTGNGVTLALAVPNWVCRFSDTGERT